MQPLLGDVPCRPQHAAVLAAAQAWIAEDMAEDTAQEYQTAAEGEEPLDEEEEGQETPERADATDDRAQLLARIEALEAEARRANRPVPAESPKPAPQANLLKGRAPFPDGPAEAS